MIKPSFVRFDDQSLKKAFYALEKGDHDERELQRLIRQAINKIERNAFCGNQIPKRLVPKEYVKKGISNLWKYDLPKGWRLFYTVVSPERPGVITSWPSGLNVRF